MKTYAQARKNERENTQIMDKVPKSPHNKNDQIHAKDRKQYFSYAS